MTDFEREERTEPKLQKKLLQEIKKKDEESDFDFEELEIQLGELATVEEEF